MKGGEGREYKDKGYSGKNIERPDFQRLLQDITLGLIKRVIVYKLDRISRSLRWWKKQLNADFVVVNGENASVVGITPRQAEDILDAGADVITMGNHTFRRREICCFTGRSSAGMRASTATPSDSADRGLSTGARFIIPR